MKLKRKPRGNVSQQFHSRVRPWMWLSVLALAMVGLLAFAVQGQMRDNGILTAEITLQDLGEVPIYGGLAEAIFPLTIQGETRVTGITTS